MKHHLTFWPTHVLLIIESRTVKTAPASTAKAPPVPCGSFSKDWTVSAEGIPRGITLGACEYVTRVNYFCRGGYFITLANSNPRRCRVGLANLACLRGSRKKQSTTQALSRDGPFAGAKE